MQASSLSLQSSYDSTGGAIFKAVTQLVFILMVIYTIHAGMRINAGISDSGDAGKENLIILGVIFATASTIYYLLMKLNR